MASMLARAARSLATRGALLVWLALSACALWAAHGFDPHVFAAATLATCTVSALLALATLAYVPRRIALALLAALPGLAALWLLGQFRWA